MRATSWAIAIAAVILVAVLLRFVSAPDTLNFAGGHRVALAQYRGPDPTGVPRELKEAGAIERGKYLALAADCASCHTVPGGVAFAGGLPFITPFGTLYSTNITPDRNTGIGAYTDAEFLNALHRGIRRDGARLYPAMPYTSYSYLTDADGLAIKAFLFSLQPAHAPAIADRLSFPFSMRSLMAIWSVLFNTDRRYEPNADRSAQWNRGAYLVEALTHCGECHTPRNLLEAPDQRRKFAGAVVDGWHAYNITADRDGGIGAWRDEDLAHYLATGHASGHGTATGPMGEAVTLSLVHLTPDDVSAMVAYLRTIPAIASDLPPLRSAAPSAVAAGLMPESPSSGQEVFEHNCADCHGQNGLSPLTPFATLLGSRAVNDPSGANVALVILSGVRDYKTMMPAFDQMLSNDDIASVTNYLTGRFGIKASRVSAATIAGIREELAQSAEPTLETDFSIPLNVALHPPIAQPIAFSHKLHVGMGLQCTNCHANPQRSPEISSPDMSLPPVQSCMGCHAVVAKNKPEIKSLTEIARSGRAVPWARVYPLTPGIHFDHGPHLRAGVQCMTCHGRVPEESALFEQTGLTSMATCIGCHRTHELPIDCKMCHGWPNEDPRVLGKWVIPNPVPYGDRPW
jgi:mono/diheme cytochrome c family protein